MRKITQQAIDAFMNGRAFKSGNTSVIADQSSSKLLLHGNMIALKTVSTGISITHAGFPTVTTKERLNGIPGVRIHQKAGKWYLHGEPWCGEWISISREV